MLCMSKTSEMVFAAFTQHCMQSILCIQWPKYIAIKYMCRILYKRSKECNVEGVEDTRYRFQCIKCYVCRRHRRWCLRLLRNTVCRVYSVYSGPSPRQEGRLVVAIRPVGLAVHHQAVRGGSFVLKCSGTCQTTRVIAGKTHSQSPILTLTKGALSNPVILTYL